MIRVFRLFVPAGTFILPISELVLLVFCYALASFVILEVDPTVFLLYGGGLAQVLPVVLTILFGLHFFDLPGDLAARSRMALVLGIAQAIGLAFIVEAFLSFAGSEWILPRWMMIYGSAFSLVCLTGWRLAYGGIASRVLGIQRVLFVGRSPAIRGIAEHLHSHPEAGFTNLGYADDSHPPGQLLDGAPVLGPLYEVRRIAEQTRPDHIVVGLTQQRDALPAQSLLDLKYSRVPVKEAAAIYEALRGRVCAGELRPAQLIFSGQLGPRPELVMLQSIYSVTLAFLVTVLTLPLMLLTAVALKLASRGPVLCRQTCVGLSGRTFVLERFRTTHADAAARTGAPRATQDDSRSTPVGRWVRRLRLDALPQWFSVLRGEVNIVGPPPERPEFVKVLSQRIPYYHLRHCVKPGLTGWAQLNCPSGETIEDSAVRLEYDLYYIKHLSLALDAVIILRTLRTMLRSRGAR